MKINSAIQPILLSQHGQSQIKVLCTAGEMVDTHIGKGNMLSSLKFLPDAYHWPQNLVHMEYLTCSDFPMSLITLTGKGG